jgi:hypothetical protein
VRGVEARDLCADPTVFASPADMLPPALHGAIALDVAPDTTTPRLFPAPSHSWVVNVSTRVSLGCDGAVRERTERQFPEPAGMVTRLQLRALPDEQRRRWVEEQFHEVVNRDVTPDVSFRGLHTAAEAPAILSSATFSSRRPLSTVTRYLGWESWVNFYAQSMKTTNRHYPYRHFGLLVKSATEYELCPSIKASFTGPELDLRSDFGTLTRRYEGRGDAVLVVTELDVPAAVIPVRDVARFNRFVDEAMAQSRVSFRLTPKL